MRERFLVGLALLALLGALPLDAAKAVVPLRPTPLKACSWEEPQFVRADRDGNVFFLRGPKLEVYPLEKSGEIGAPVRLEPTGPVPSFVIEAAMDPSGKKWLLLADGRARLFVDEKEQELPRLDDQPWSVGFVRDSPVVASIPLPREGRKGNPPWLVEAGSDRWNEILDFAAAYPGDPIDRGQRNEIVAQSAAFLVGGHDGKLWVARRYAYRIEHYTLGGRRLQELRVGDGKVRRNGNSEPRTIDLPADASTGSKATIHPFTGLPVIVDFTEARDRNLYLLVRAESGGLAIDRYDPSADLLERRELSVDAGAGRMTLAAGKDGLYLAAWNGRGRWRIAWDQLSATRDWSELRRAGK